MSALFAPPESRESSGMGSQREIERVDDEWSVQLPLNHKKKTQVWECEEEEQFCTTTTTTNVVQVDAEIVRQIQGRASITSRLVHVPTMSSPPRPNHTEYFWPVWTRLTRTIYRRELHVRTSKCGWYPYPIMYIVWSPYVKGAYGCLGRREHSNREEVVLVRPRTTLKRFVCGGNRDLTLDPTKPPGVPRKFELMGFCNWRCFSFWDAAEHANSCFFKYCSN